jgi:hypothetical protein
LTRAHYNQIANYAYTQSEINIRIGNRSPADYFKGVLAQCEGGELRYGAIADRHTLSLNLAQNCVPEAVFEMDVDGYEEFLRLRRVLIAKKIKDYYDSL